ncbi:DUF3606 domain-containing protein [Chitinophaga rhizophila]|uniref:DUF3606 domain-containing protein n=1 Tax=Chitinophaga rhizophila TaxID=2866212 RepID=A0ABS7GM75_9BACT|nr:DUF3606 domain-containing protein [Chitinophaga rhizophila]MBW8687887.1 DUF3606 domain-containing protein [Chitinophaga rhizophila]
MEDNKLPGGVENTDAPQPQEFRMNELALELGVSTEELQQAVEIVGDDPVRVKEFIRRNHSESDDTNEV